MKNKKSQINQVFIYILSVIIIGFIGFLVVKFIYSLTKDLNEKADIEFIDNIKNDFTSVYESYGAQKVLTYKVSPKISLVCFVPNNNCLNKLVNITRSQNESLNISVESGNNLVLFNDDEIVRDSNIGLYNGLCECLKPKLNRFSIVMTNEENKVIINKGP